MQILKFDVYFCTFYFVASRIARLHSTNQLNAVQLQSMQFQGPMAMMQQKDMTNLQKISVSSLAGPQSMQFQGPMPTMQQNNMTSLQKNSDLTQLKHLKRSGILHNCS